MCSRENFYEIIKSFTRIWQGGLFKAISEKTAGDRLEGEGGGRRRRGETGDASSDTHRLGYLL